MRKEVKVNTKYQIVIPKEIREKLEGIKPGKKVYIEVDMDNNIKLSLKEKAMDNWIKSTQGIARGAWGSNSTKWLDDLREEWENK